MRALKHYVDWASAAALAACALPVFNCDYTGEIPVATRQELQKTLHRREVLESFREVRTVVRPPKFLVD